MSLVYAEPVEETWEKDLSDAAFQLRLRPESEIPWWAMELLNLEDPGEVQVRGILRYGRPRGAGMWNVFAELVARAESTVMTKSIDDWRDLCYNDTAPDGSGGKLANLVRDAALLNPRAFLQFCDLRDEEGGPLTLKVFHLEMLKAMRRTEKLAMILVAFGHGKSLLSSRIVPLMDWAEWPMATQSRIYLDQDLARKWIGFLMQDVEHDEAMHKLFPWIRKPKRGDQGFQIWSTDGFAIGGNPNRVRSFEPHTIKSGSPGFRFHRIGVDDVVSDKEAHTASIQEGYERYIKAVALSARQRTRRPRSKYGTVFPGFYIVGTPYDRADVNWKLYTEYRELGYKTVRRPVFVHNDHSQVIWPEARPLEMVQKDLEEMGPRNFGIRMLLNPGGRDHSLFPEADVDWAIKDGRADSQHAQWCEVPPNTRLIIGFDPASGNAVSHHGARYPAFVVYGARDGSSFSSVHPSQMLRDYDGPVGVTQQPEIFHHVVQWGRMEGVGFHSQCQKIVELARAYNCPVAFENNTLQESYGDEISKIATDVKVFSHTTGNNKRDPSQGVDQFEPLFVNRRMIIHADGAPAHAVKALRDELVNWKGSTEKATGFTDLVMALWIARFQFALHVQASVPAPPPRRSVPAYAQRFATPWYRQR
jgi:hypothetical protein